MKRVFPFVFLFVGLVGCDVSEPPQIPPADHQTVAQPIVNGTRDPQTVPLTTGEITAIGWLFPAGRPSQWFCTGTLVAPNLVLTARHCTWGASGGDIGFGVGLLPTDPDDTFESTAIYSHPTADVAMIVLGEDATATGLEITPMVINTATLDDTLVDKAVQVGGYGETQDPTREGRWFATVYVADVAGDEVVVDGRGDQGICFGDSGGPLIDLDADGNPVILAIEYWGDESCVDIDHMTRLDPVYDWIGPVLAGEVPEDPCQGVDRTGRCVDNVAQSCRRGELRENDCTALGTECAYIEEARRYDCTCGELDAIGWCNGDVLEYCDDGRYRLTNCGIRGQSCGYVNGTTGYDCIDTAMCRAEDEVGRCDGDTAINCTGGNTTRELCFLDGLVCDETETGAECVDAPPADEEGDADVDVDMGFPDVGDMADDPVGDGSEASPPPQSDECGGCATAPGRSPAGFTLLGLLALFAVTRRRTAR